VITVVSGQVDRPVRSRSRLVGTLVIRAHDSEAAIALDAVQVGYDEWKGPVSAGPHEVYVLHLEAPAQDERRRLRRSTTEFDAKLTPADAVADAPGRRRQTDRLRTFRLRKRASSDSCYSGPTRWEAHPSAT